MAVSNDIFGTSIGAVGSGAAGQYFVSNGTAGVGIGYAQQAISQRDYDRMKYEEARRMEEQRRYEQMLGQGRYPWEEPKKEEPREKPQTDPLGFLKKADTKLLLTQEN